MTLHTHGLHTLEQVRAFVAASEPLDIEIHERQAAYDFVTETLRRFAYTRLSKADKGLIVRYLIRVTGRSRQQVTRLIAQLRASGEVRDRRGAPAKPFTRRYTRGDIRQLADVDARHATLSGPATRKLCERAYHVFGDTRFERLATISNGHLYNLRAGLTYQRCRGHVDKTRPTRVAIGERRKPTPQGRPGFLRVDSVHQDDLDADNGSEYINHRVVCLLAKLHVGEFTKSRARQTNDNALVESKNGSTVRKHLGYAHIPARFAEPVNTFTQQRLSPYLNFHRPCYFPSEATNAKGRIRKHYRQQDLMTPYDKLKSLPEASTFLKPGVTFEQLDAIAYAMSDNEAAERLNEARSELFRAINNALTCAA